MVEYCRAVVFQMRIVDDSAPIVADHFGKPLLALEERLIAKIIVLQVDQVKATNVALYPSRR